MNKKNLDKIKLALSRHFEGITLKKAARFLSIELLFLALIIGLDILTKELIYQKMVDSGNNIVIIKGVLVLTPIENSGASFGIFQNKTFALSIVSLVTVVFIAIFEVFTIKNRNFFLRSGLVMILGGGIGNLIDRFMLGYVRDFIYFELIDFAVFNVADSSLTVGVILILIFVLFYYRPDDSKKKDSIAKVDDAKVDDAKVDDAKDGEST